MGDPPAGGRPRTIERILTEAPVPAAAPEEAQRNLISGVAKATRAHTRALVEIAAELEGRPLRYPDDWPNRP